ncbi:Ribonuclease H-like domain containing protein [Amanita muscaria]
MPSRSYYAVKIGRQAGVFPTWKECEKQVKGFPGARYRKCVSSVEAAAYIEGHDVASATASDMPSTHTGNKRALSGIEDQDVVYCDGACKGNGKAGAVAGIGVWWDHDDPRNISERCPGDQTNNCAELVAIVRILETAPTSAVPLVIKSDSVYSCNALQSWLPMWEKNGYRTAGGQPVKNIDLIRYTKALLDARKEAGQNVKLEHVRGHMGITGNEGADVLAVQGASMPALEDRNWKALERDVRRMIAEEDTGSLSPADGSSPKSPKKARRISVDEPYPSSSVSPSSSSSPPAMIRPIQLPFSPPSSSDRPKRNLRSNARSNPPMTELSIVVDPKDIDMSLYVGCLLEENELWKDLVD